MLRRAFYVGFIGFLFTLAGYSQSFNAILDSIVPLRTDRNEVEKFLGVAGQDGVEVQYKSGDLIINVTYSAGECEKIPLRSYRLKVKKDTVISYELVPGKRVDLSELNVNLNEFLRDDSGDLINFVTYRKKNGGTDIVVKIQEELRLVNSVRRFPTTIDLEDCGCP